MSIEIALIKPVVDALLSLFKQADNLRLQRNAEAALADAIRELLQAHPDENKAEAQIAIARAAGILSADVVLAEDMLQKHRAAKPRLARKRSGRAPASGKRSDPPPPDADESGAGQTTGADDAPRQTDEAGSRTQRSAPARARPRQSRTRTPTTGN